jgi:osmotically-inducible protein OsmY
MLRALLKLVLLLMLVAAAAAFFLGYRIGDNGIEAPASARQAVPTLDTGKARETGAAIGEKVATGAARAREAMNEGTLTAKIKSKMALDDTIDATSIDVDTDGSVVTLSGRVRSQAERDKAVALARDTAGVTAVIDRLTIR